MAIDDLVDPSADDPLDSPPHAGQHAALNDAARELDAALTAHEALPHGGGSGGTSDHALLTNVTPNQHHNKAHAMQAGPALDHTMTSTAGWVYQATGTNTAGFAPLADASIPAGITRDTEAVLLAPAGGQVIQAPAAATPLTIQQAVGSTTDVMTVRGSDGVDRVRLVILTGTAAQFIFQDSAAPQIRAHTYANNANVPNVVLAKSRSATIGTPGTIVNNADGLGTVSWQADDGATIATQAAAISAQVDGVPAAGDIPGRLVFLTRAKAGAVAERMRIDQAGRVGIGVIPAAGAGKLSVPDGITFPAVNVPSTDVNTLDDYQEGQFTPTLTAGTPGDLAGTTNVTYGRFVKIGRMVQFWIRLQHSAFSWTTATGNLRVTGLPIQPMTAAGMQWPCTAMVRYTKANYAGIIGVVSSGDANVYFVIGGTAGAQPTLMQIGDVPTGSAPQVYVAGAYETDL